MATDVIVVANSSSSSSSSNGSRSSSSSSSSPPQDDPKMAQDGLKIFIWFFCVWDNSPTIWSAELDPQDCRPLVYSPSLLS